MNAKRILKAYGLWLGGVLTAAFAAWLLYRSRAITYELDDYYSEDGNGGDLGLAEVLPAPEPIYGPEE